LDCLQISNVEQSRSGSIAGSRDDDVHVLVENQLRHLRQRS
jgi:hypothetical protein